MLITLLTKTRYCSSPERKKSGRPELKFFEKLFYNYPHINLIFPSGFQASRIRIKAMNKLRTFHTQSKWPFHVIFKIGLPIIASLTLLSVRLLHTLLRFSLFFDYDPLSEYDYVIMTCYQRVSLNLWLPILHVLQNRVFQ